MPESTIDSTRLTRADDHKVVARALATVATVCSHQPTCVDAVGPVAAARTAAVLAMALDGGATACDPLVAADAATWRLLGAPTAQATSRATRDVLGHLDDGGARPWGSRATTDVALLAAVVDVVEHLVTLARRLGRPADVLHDVVAKVDDRFHPLVALAAMDAEDDLRRILMAAVGAQPLRCPGTTIIIPDIAVTSSRR